MFGLGGKDVVQKPGLRLAFTGKSGSGKTTASRMVCEGRQPSATLSFADPVRAIVGMLYNCNPQLPVHKGVFREKMQAVGLALRSVDENIFVEATINQILAANPTATIAVDDVRFVNEAEALHKCGFIIVRLVREKGRLTGEAATHPSEVEQDGIQVDYTVRAENLKELHEELSKIVKECGGEEVAK